MTENEMATMLELIEFSEDESPEATCRAADAGCVGYKHVSGCIMATLEEAKHLIYDYRKEIMAKRILAHEMFIKENTCSWSGLSKKFCTNTIRHNCTASND